MRAAIGQAWTEHLRLACLRACEAAPGGSLNDSLITDCVREVGIAATRDQVRGALAWLAEQGLVATDDLGSLVVATLTTRGHEVAVGIASHPGVKRPSPGAR